MQLLPKLKAIDLALVVDNNLIISDIHLGYEESLNKRGILVPKFQYEDTIKRLDNIFKEIKKQKIDSPVEIFADSKYVITGINEWIHNWVKNSWRTSANKAVLNQELWQELHKLNQEFKPKWHYVKGHNGDKWNDRADEIATSFADNEPVKLRK